MRRLRAAVALALALQLTAGLAPRPAVARPAMTSYVVRLTWYPATGSATASGVWPYVGVAACPYWVPFWTTVWVGSDPYTCLDTSARADGLVDLYDVPDVASRYGDWVLVSFDA